MSPVQFAQLLLLVSLVTHLVAKSWKRYRGSRPDVFFEKGILKKISKTTMSSSFLIKLQPCSLQYQKSLRHRCFPVSFAKFLRTYNLWNPCKWLLPKMPKAENTTQPVFTCSKLTIKTLEQSVKYVPKLIIKTPERRQLRLSRVFIVNFEHIPHLVLMFPLLTLNMLFPAGKLLTVFFLLFSKMILGWQRCWCLG